MKNTSLSVVALVLFLLVVSGVPEVTACRMTMVPGPRRSMVNPSSYILVGEVIGYSEPISSTKFDGKAVGLKIRAVEPIQLPVVATDYYELFVFGVTPWCAPSARDHNKFPIGTRLRIVAFESTLLDKRSPENRVRLESKIFDLLSIVNESDGLETTVDSRFDYQNKLYGLFDRTMIPGNEELRRPLWDFLFLEASKDLIRLKNATTENEVLEILGRLLYFRNVNFRRLVYFEIGKPFLTEETQIPFNLLGGKNPTSPEGRKLSAPRKRLLDKRLELEKAGKLRWF